MPPERPSKKSPNQRPPAPPSPSPARRQEAATASRAVASMAVPVEAVGARAAADFPVAVSAGADSSGVVTARRAGGLRDVGLRVDPELLGVKAALQHLAKAVNIAFQTDYGENYLEAVYQAAIVRNGEIIIVHKEYFGFRETWFGQLGMLFKSMSLTLDGPDPASPEGRQRIEQKGPSSIRGLFNLIARKLDLVAEFEDRVPAYVQQMFDRLEASGIIIGWDRDDWDIWTTKVGLNIHIAPSSRQMQQEVPGES